MRDAARWYQYAWADFYLEFADKIRSVQIEIISCLFVLCRQPYKGIREY